MNTANFLRLMWMIYGKGKVDIKKIQKMGLLAVKIGQVHALRADFLDPAKCQELTKLYRAAPPVPSEEVLSKIDRSLFSELDEKPLASASIGQVYRAQLKKGGDDVVVKIVKSRFKQQFTQEVQSLKKFFNFVAKIYSKFSSIFDPQAILKHIEQYTLQEMDLRNEMKGHDALKKLYEENKDAPELENLRFPKIYKELSGSDVMVSEFLDGPTFDQALQEGNLPFHQLLELFKIHAFYLFKLGMFHDDLHPGNMMLVDGKIYFVDTGAVGHVKKKMRLGLYSLFKSLSVYDYSACAKHMNEMSNIQIKGEAFEHFEKAFLELYKEFKGKTLKEVSLSRQMMESIKLGINCGMRFDENAFSVIKSFMFLDGMALRAKPDCVLMDEVKELFESFVVERA